jgi:molybdopterin molybdotransferase
VVAILGSGDELVPVDFGTLPAGRRRDSNAWQLAAAVAEAGGLPRVLPTVVDDLSASLAAVADAARTADVLLTSGGVSVGDHDHLAAALRRLAGNGLGFHKVALRPGKPFAFGRLGPCFVFGLPGNPVSAGVTFELFVRPALRALAGHARCFRRATLARLVGGLPPGDGRESWLRGSVQARTDGPWIDVGRTQSSGALSSLAGADALLRVPVGAPAQAAGARVWIHRLDTDDAVAAFDPGEG